MYKQVKTDKEATLDNDDPTGFKFSPVATLADEHGGRCQIVIDDHCYQLLIKRPNGTYGVTKWIFKEVFEVLKTLPPPT